MAGQQAKYLGGIVIALCTFATVSLAAFANDDYPRNTSVYNTKEDSQITFDCELENTGELVCEATQTSIISKESKSLQEVISEATNQWNDDQKFSAEECALYRTMVDFFEGRSPPPNASAKEFIETMPSSHKVDFILLVEAMVKFCDTPNFNNFLKIIRLGHDKSMRTCKIMTNQFTQRFYRAGPETWSAKPDPTGECGVVRLDRFERVKPSQNYDLFFWDYVSKKAITNPKGSSLMIPCSELDEDEYLFSWKQRELNRSCDYIEF